MTSPIYVATITREEHLAFVRTRRSVSFLQTPAWGEVKTEWRSESIGFFADGALVGAGLVLYRQLPRFKRYLAYLPEGPDIDWDAEHLSDWLAPMTLHLSRQRAFAIRMGPPVVTSRWSAEAVKDGIADPAVRRLGQVTPTARSATGARVVSQLAELGWHQQAGEGGFSAGQPRYNFWLPLAGRTDDDVLRGMNQLWRRNIKKADKSGVVVTVADPESDLKLFHDLYVHTAERDRFTPRPLSYFQTMFSALLAEEPDRIRLYLARHEGDLVASTVWVRVGAHTWYAYGASSSEKRDVRGSNAIQWRMIKDAMATGAEVFDLRGITDTLDPDDAQVGLIQFKVGTGGEAVEYVGEWDLPVRRTLYKAFSIYLRRR